MSELAVRVEGLSKQYQLGARQASYSTLRDRLSLLASAPLRAFRGRVVKRQRTPSFWALKDVSFEVRAGEMVGIIGRNGAGKSTLLKILSRITEPTEGEVDINGRVGSLLEVGTGFHPELTGRENVYLNGAILGMKRSEITRKFDEIVSFAEVEKFIDTPVKHYSSGMYMRLAFAVAAHLEPEILIVDEVLAVGDAEFQKKCLGKMKDVAKVGRTVLFVSHNMAAVQSLCTRVCLLREGRLSFDGPVDEAMTIYTSADRENQTGRWSRVSKVAGGELYFSEIVAHLEGEQPCLKLILDLDLRSEKQHAPAFLAVDLLDELNITFMQALPGGVLDSEQVDYQIRLTVDLPPLVPGKYWASLWVGHHNTTAYDYVAEAVCIEITSSPCQDRTFPHSRDHGWIVPRSWIEMGSR